MLVLALQFSRGEPCWVRRVRSPPRGGLDAEAQRGVGSSNSLKTEEKTVVVGGVAHEEGRTLRPVRSTDDDPPVHQLGVQTSGDQMITDDVEWTP